LKPAGKQKERPLKKERGFTLIELLIVVSIIGLFFSVTLPVSVEMYNGFKASSKAQEIMIHISGIRRQAFLYSERKVLTAVDGVLRVNDVQMPFPDIHIQMKQAISFSRNGTTSGGVIEVRVGDQLYLVSVSAPMGNLVLERADNA
jgi:prepilin-type N-terminal cleavage/methylation domain-containing protein